MPGTNAKPQESSQILAAGDDKYFYLAGTFLDSDIVAEGLEDGLHQYQFGDVCELFLKPVDYSWYWELYGTPLGQKTTFWFPGQGRLGLPSSFEKYSSGLKVAAINRGTVNEWQDYDEGWTIEMTIPIKDLTARGEKFGSDSGWRIHIGRYNYSRYLENKGPELSAFPKLSRTDFHLLNEYAVLKLQR
ncbi:MAG: hypothetical protein A2Y12_02475 [Planctomycetes bacterium GWF2_42_9]|nr:MAG: hypothetical protein A2Y12_02475 [Planctomycetes bacterium GWF2_42_9]